MLYDPKWEKQAKTDPFTLGSLIAWLEMRPAGERYCYFDGGDCLLTQYFTFSGLPNVHVFDDCFYHGDEPLPRWIGREEAQTGGWPTVPLSREFHGIARTIPWTFGAALDRARATLAAS